jgi:hypothetical protein
VEGAAEESVPAGGNPLKRYDAVEASDVLAVSIGT